MKKMKKLTFLLTLLIILAVILLITLTSDQKLILISPLLKNERVLGINLWFPQQNLENDNTAPQISAKAALFVNTHQGKVLFEKNIHEKLPIASLVKVMTVLIALEHKGMNDEFQVSQKAADMEPDKMFLIAGEQLSLKELLYGVFLVSANDAAEVLAQASTGNREEFLDLMNSKASQLGMKNTYFANPTGLDEDINNSYSTVYDLSILTRYLIREFPELVNISKTEHIFIPASKDHQDYDMYSGINLLTTYPGVVGFKTGYTPEAGLTLITLAQKDEYEVIGVLLGTENRRDEARV